MESEFPAKTNRNSLFADLLALTELPPLTFLSCELKCSKKVSFVLLTTSHPVGNLYIASLTYAAKFAQPVKFAGMITNCISFLLSMLLHLASKLARFHFYCAVSLWESEFSKAFFIVIQFNHLEFKVVLRLIVNHTRSTLCFYL